LKKEIKTLEERDYDWSVLSKARSQDEDEDVNEHEHDIQDDIQDDRNSNTIRAESSSSEE
jgi:hypothetical protein